MRLRKGKQFLCICMSSIFALSIIAYGEPITITPLEESQVSTFQSGKEWNSRGGELSNGPGSSGNTGSSPSGIQTPSGTPGGAPQSSPGSQSNPGSQSSPGNQSGLGNQSSSGNQISPGNQTGQSSGGSVNGGSGGISVNLDLGSSVSKPVIASEGAVLMEASTGTVLFSQNGDKQFYPASITKLMTALVVAERSSLDSNVTFSATATTNLESGAVSINMTAGDVMTVRQCLYALLLKSANEVGNALAEYVAGSNQAFAQLMNDKAASLGCTNTHFTNPHGLNDTNHLTTPHDMALIARAAFNNEIVKTIAAAQSYALPATIKNPSGLSITMSHKMLNPKDSRYYEGAIGGKTGYTSKAGNTLVTVAQRNGVRLIAVVMKSKSTHYTDTRALFDYGYELVNAGAIKASGTGAFAPAGGSASGAQGPGSAFNQGWVQDSNGWYYIKDNGAKAANEWQTIDGVTYWFDSNAYMAKGWRQISGTWYFLRSNGAMAKNQWEQVEQNGQWFYLGENGAMLTNTTTPDGHRVDENGVWVQ